MPRCRWFENDQIYACMDPSGNFGDLWLLGCEVGCRPCDTGNNDAGAFASSIGVSSFGLRHVRPRQGAESRNARGALERIHSNRPVRLPRGRTEFSLAPCWDNFGREFHQLDFCDCPPPLCREEDDPLPPFYRLFVKIATCWWFRGVQWPPREMQCTHTTYGHDPMLVPMESTNLGQGAFARTEWCTSNLLVVCRGEVHPENVCISETPWGRPFYVENHRLWDIAQILDISARFVDDPTAPVAHRAVVAAKNKVMQYVEDDRQQGFDGLLHFDQMDAAPSNSALDFWARGKNLLNDPGWESIPVIMELPGSHLVGSGHPIIAEYVMVNASFWMSLVSHVVKEQNPLGPLAERAAQYLPMIRMTLQFDMGVRVRFPGTGEHFLLRTWNDPPDNVLLSLDNQADGAFPRVLPENLDRIRYVDAQGRTFSPPARITWKGHMGFLSDPPTETTFDWDYDERPDIANQPWAKCCSFARAMDGVVVQAIESHPETSDTRRLWRGSVKLRFRSDPKEGFCPE